MLVGKMMMPLAMTARLIAEESLSNIWYHKSPQERKPPEQGARANVQEVHSI
jgi:hypothetical protein